MATRRPKWFKAYFNATPGAGPVGRWGYIGACGAENPSRADSFSGWEAEFSSFVGDAYRAQIPADPAALNGGPGLDYTLFGYQTSVWNLQGSPQRFPIYTRADDPASTHVHWGDSLSSDGDRRVHFPGATALIYYVAFDVQYLSVNYSDDPSLIGSSLWIVDGTESEAASVGITDYWFDPPDAPPTNYVPTVGGGASGGNGDGSFSGYVPTIPNPEDSFHIVQTDKPEQEKPMEQISNPEPATTEKPDRTGAIMGGALLWLAFLYWLTKKEN